MATPPLQPSAAPLTQPSATSILQAGTVPINPQAMNALGARLSTQFTRYEGDRRMAELQWQKNARQYLGVYDPDIEKAIGPVRSKAYPKVTRVKCVSMLSRLMNLLFPVDDKNWTVAPSPVPDLEEQDLQTVLDQLMPPDGSEAPPDAVIEQAIRDFAKKRARRLELEVSDQLAELGGECGGSYVALCRQVLQSGIKYGCGVMMGPFVEEVTTRKWQASTGPSGPRLTAMAVQGYRPRFEFVSLWDYYPDMSAKTFAQMDGQYLRVVMSRHQLNALKKRADFLPEQINKFLAQSPSGNYRRRQHETELRSMGAQLNTAATESNKYEAIVWDGHVDGRTLAECGVAVPADKMGDDLRAQVWMLGSLVIKAELDPWTTLAPEYPMKRYHHFIFEDDESFLLGNSLPQIVRDSQMGIAAAARILIDNASVLRNLEVNANLLRGDTDVQAITPDKIWYRDDESVATVQYPAVRVIDMPTKLPELTGMITLFQGFADQETFVNPASGGDLQKGPSEPFRTAAGASMLRGDAALPFKDVVRNFDIFTESVINALLVFNRVFNTNPEVRGDFQAVARGATSLIAKEVHGIQLDNLAQTLTEEEKRYINMRKLARERIRVRDLDADDLVYDDAKCDQIDQQAAEQAQQQSEMAMEAARAEIRKTLSEIIKNLATAGEKNAGSQATIANTILAALEKGINPDMLAADKAVGEGNDDGSTNGGAPAAGGPAADAAAEPAGTGLGGMQAALGSQAGGQRPRAAAMPAG